MKIGTNSASSNIYLYIPAEKKDTFNKILSSIGSEISYSETQTNLTDSYYETTERIKNQQVMLERLRELAKQKSKSIYDLLEVEKRT